MFCSKCGKQIPDDSQFCAGCGYRIGSQVVVNESPQIANHQTSTLLISGKSTSIIFDMMNAIFKLFFGFLFLFNSSLVLLIVSFFITFNLPKIWIYLISIFLILSSIPNIHNIYCKIKTHINVYNDHLEGVATDHHFNLTYEQIGAVDINNEKIIIFTKDTNIKYECYADNNIEIEEIINNKRKNVCNI